MAKTHLNVEPHPITIGPVTGSGWYENTDGTVTRYDWRNGWLCAGVTVSGWAAVPSSLDAAAVRS